MKIERWKTPLIILAVGSALFGCAQWRGQWKDWTSGQPLVLKSGGVTQEAQPQPRKLVILMYGFFNSEASDKFEPAEIAYAGMRFSKAHATISEQAGALEWEGSMRVLSWAETEDLFNRSLSETERALISSRLLAALDVLDRTVQTRKLPVETVGTLKAPYLPPQGWGQADRILTVIGLETVRRPNPGGFLTSVLGCFWFSGDTSYLGAIIVRYDFDKFGTAELAATASGKCLRVSSGK